MNKKIVSVIAISLTMLSLSGLYIYTHPKIARVINSSIPFQSKEDLIIKSSLIVRGKVDKKLDSKSTNSKYKYNKENKVEKTITTDYIIDIEEIFKGDPYNKNKITVRNEGGNIKGEKDSTLIVDSYPDFKPNEEVILFLKNDKPEIADGENYYILTGLRQGKFSFSRKVTDLNDLEYKSDSYYILLNNFKNEIKSALENAKNHPDEDEMTPEEVRKNNEKYFGESVNSSVY